MARRAPQLPCKWVDCVSETVKSLSVISKTGAKECALYLQRSLTRFQVADHSQTAVLRFGDVNSPNFPPGDRDHMIGEELQET